MTTYCIGFMFDVPGNGVLLAAYRAGALLNGICGVVGPDDISPRNAMVREFRTQTGINSRPQDWRLVECICENGQGTYSYALRVVSGMRVPTKTSDGRYLLHVKMSQLEAYCDCLVPSIKEIIPMAWQVLQEGNVRGGQVSSAGPNEAPAQQGSPRDLGPGQGTRAGVGKGYCTGTAGWPAGGDDLLAPSVPRLFQAGDVVHSRDGILFGTIRAVFANSVLVASKSRGVVWIHRDDVIKVPVPEIVYRYFGNSVFCNRNKCQAGTICDECREMKAASLPPMQEQCRDSRPGWMG